MNQHIAEELDKLRAVQASCQALMAELHLAGDSAHFLVVAQRAKLAKAYGDWDAGVVKELVPANPPK